MDLRYTEAEQAFRADLRRVARHDAPGLPPSRHPTTGRGGAPTTPTGSGCCSTPATPGSTGPSSTAAAGASPVEQLIFHEELERAHAPYVGVNFVGLLHAGPTIIAEGTPEQRARLPARPSCAATRCGARGSPSPTPGSDLASLRTRAVRDGDDYVVTGPEDLDLARRGRRLLRAAGAHRRRGSRHRGITWLILPMDTPGIEIRPLHDHRRVHRVRRGVPRRGPGAGGQPGRRGERRLAGGHGDPQLRAGHRLRRRPPRGHRAPGGDGGAGPARPGPGPTPAIRRQAGHLRAELDALWALTKRNVSQAARTGHPRASAAPSSSWPTPRRASKLGEFSLDLLGRAGLAADDSRASTGSARCPGTMVEDWLRGISLTIAAGTSQIQRNIVAERILGLPKEPRAAQAGRGRTTA